MKSQNSPSSVKRLYNVALIILGLRGRSGFQLLQEAPENIWSAHSLEHFSREMYGSLSRALCFSLLDFY